MSNRFGQFVRLIMAATVCLAGFAASVHVHVPNGECTLHSHDNSSSVHCHIHSHEHGHSHPDDNGLEHSHSQSDTQSSDLPVSPKHDSDHCTICQFSAGEGWFELSDGVPSATDVSFYNVQRTTIVPELRAPSIYQGRAPPVS